MSQQSLKICERNNGRRFKGRYVFLGGGRAGEYWYFFQKKVLALPHVLIKKLLTPPLLGDWQKCDPPLTTTWYAPCHRNLRTFFDILLVNAKCLNMNKSRYWICARWNKKMRTISVGSGLYFFLYRWSLNMEV